MMLFLPTIAICALATVPLVAAAPADVGSPRPQPSHAPFTFEQWADDIIHNPMAQHLSAKEATEASIRARNIGIGWQHGAPYNTSGPEDYHRDHFDKRTVFLKSKSAGNGKIIDVNTVRCNSFPTKMAPIEDAAWCIQWLASQDGTVCVVNEKEITGFCRSKGKTFILGWRKNKPSLHQSTCQEIARTAGRIMDYCTSSGFVQGDTAAWNDTATGVMIRTFESGEIDRDLKLEM
ncbi:hypothetical protein CORC01_10077 [Colletotrichum orchidophilum]|uniref:Ecp2 effector protein domain-containing protein n=1 Tax=Colletotrichum orchidophilum TaxID=1209926 RepID=A0A1G4AZY9_9PEZI|nr:uncharacterized protein CORC01_10077 [Colletotrichum orchidophilum]OHE94676.1 hypothetical protein CORC01_10077 [Colletotrichum orchidophilum]